ncbi:MAG: hypothetical protein ACPGSB_03795, partial [Opitutales bacterium]
MKTQICFWKDLMCRYNFKLKNGQDYLGRKADLCDFDGLFNVLIEVAKEDEIAPLTFREAEKQILDSKDRLMTLLKDGRDDFVYLVGVVEGKVVAFCDIHIGANERNSHVAEFGRSV